MMDGRVSDEPQYVKYKVFCRVRPHHVQGKREHDVSVRLSRIIITGYAVTRWIVLLRFSQHTITNTGEEKQILSVQHRRVITTKNPRRIEKTDYYDFRWVFFFFLLRIKYNTFVTRVRVGGKAGSLEKGRGGWRGRRHFMENRVKIVPTVLNPGP